MRKNILVGIVLIMVVISISVAWSIQSFFAKPENTWNCKIDNNQSCVDGHRALRCTNALGEVNYTIGDMTCSDECPSCVASENV